MIKKFAYFYTLILVSCFTSIKIPQYHRSWLRYKVGNEVVKLVNPSTMNSGGTGFHVQTPKGVMILTNDHICEHASENGFLKAKTDYDKDYQLVKVLKTSNESDLCIVEPLKNHLGLKLAGHEELGKIYHLIGHPELMSITMTEGELINTEYVLLTDHVISLPNDCKLPKNVIEGIYCINKIKAHMSTVPGLPGNSGSPLVNGLGRVVGVLFAGNEAFWSAFVPLNDIKKFLASY